jgi:hypothetical protein
VIFGHDGADYRGGVLIAIMGAPQELQRLRNVHDVMHSRAKPGHGASAR